LRFLRDFSVFALCAFVSLVILDLGLVAFSPTNVGGGELVFAGLLFLPFIIVGGLVFGSILLLTSDRRSRSRMPWLVSRGAVCGAVYAVFIMLAFGAVVPSALMYVAAGGVAGATSGFLWCRLVEQQDA
jgi:hypothetical protein